MNPLNEPKTAGENSSAKKVSRPKGKKVRRRKTGVLLNQSELAEALGRCPRTIRNWDKARILPMIVIRGAKFYRLDRCLEALERKHTYIAK